MAEKNNPKLKDKAIKAFLISLMLITTCAIFYFLGYEIATQEFKNIINNPLEFCTQQVIKPTTEYFQKAIQP